MAQRNQNIFVAATAAFQKKFGKLSANQVLGFDISRPAGWIEYWDDQNGTAQPVISVDASTGITHFNNSNGQVFDTAVTLSGGLTDSATDAITAVTPGAQSTAFLLPSVVNRVTTATATGDGVKLPPAVAGLSIIVVNSSTFNIQVYGSGTDTINDSPTATGVAQPINATTVYWCPKGGVAGKWYSGTVDAFASLTDTAGNPAIVFTATASAVNGLTETNSATGDGTNNAVVLAASGSDAAVRFDLRPKGAAGQMVLGLATGTGDIKLGSSSGAQAVKIADGAGAPTVNVANTSTAGATVSVAGAVTAAAATDTVNIAGGNAAATAFKKVNIAAGVPGTSGNNQVIVGGGSGTKLTLNATVVQYAGANVQTAAGSNNAITANLVDAAGNNVPLASGLELTLQLANTLQAGANTLALNGGSAKSIVSSRNSANNIATGYAATGVINLFYDGTAWRDTSQ